VTNESAFTDIPGAKAKAKAKAKATRVITKNNRAVKVQFKHKSLIQPIRGNNTILAAGEKAG